MAFRIEHDLEDPRAIVKALSAVAETEGVTLGLYEALEKSQADNEHLPEERHLLGMVRALEARYSETIERLGNNLSRWIETRFPSYHVSGLGIFKAEPGVKLTPAQIEELRQLIAAHFHPEGIGDETASWTLPEPVWRLWQHEGIVVRGFRLPEIADAYQAGRLFQVISDGLTYEHMKVLAAELPVTRPTQLAIEWAEQHAAQYITGFGAKLATQAAEQALSLNQRIGRELISGYLKGDLKVARTARGPAHDLTLQERTALESETIAKDWKTLGRELYKTFKGSEAKRDWLRVAVSETRLAYNVGSAHALEEQGVMECYYLVKPTACAHCKKLYLLPSGTPRVFRLSQIMTNIDRTGGMNVGLKASKIGTSEGWTQTGLAHPWCQCKLMPHVAGMPLLT